MGKIGKSRFRKNISIVAALVLFLNSIIPTVPVFATGDEENGDSTPTCESGYHLDDLDECVADESAPESEPETLAQEQADLIHCIQDSESLPDNAEYIDAVVEEEDTPCEIKCIMEGYDLVDGVCVKIEEEENPEFKLEKNGLGGEGIIQTRSLCEGKEAKIGDDCYTTLADAFAVGGTVKLLKDITLTDSIDVANTVTLDLNGKTISVDGVSSHKFSANSAHDYVFGIKRGGKLTIDDTSEGTEGTVNAGDLYTPLKVTILGEGDNGDKAELHVKKGTFIGYYYGISGNGGRNNTKVTIDGGRFVSNAPANAGDGAAVYHPQEGELTINGGRFEAIRPAIEIRAGNLTITDGVFESTGNPASVTSNGNGTTTVGAAIAVAQHTTNKQITVVIN